MSVRIHVPLPLGACGQALTLPPQAGRHVQVLRLQPGDALELFNENDGAVDATVLRMGRQEVVVQLGAARATPAVELPCQVTVALGMPANERMDTVVEKATELGVGVLQPLHCARSVLRLSGERAERRQAHWQAVAEAAAEQSGRLRVPRVEPIATLPAWLQGLAAPQAGECRCVLSLADDARPLREVAPGARRLVTLSGPEGGLEASEEALARAAGFVPVTLGPRVLRADTAPLAVLAWLGLSA